MYTCKIIMYTCKIIMNTCIDIMYTCKIFMYTCKIIMYTCKIIMYTYSHDIFFTQVKMYVVQWKTYVVMSLQGHRRIRFIWHYNFIRTWKTPHGWQYILEAAITILVLYNDVLGKPMVSFWLVMCCCGWVGQNTLVGGWVCVCVSKYYDSILTPIYTI